MINPEAVGIRIIDLTPGYVSKEESQGADQPAQIDQSGALKRRVLEAVDGLRHHWGLTLPEGIEAAVREDVLQGRELGQEDGGIQVYRRGAIRRGSMRRAPGILSTTSEGERFDDGAHLKESTTHMVTHPTTVWHFRRGTPGVYYAADLRGTEHETNPPRRMRRPKPRANA